MIDDEMGFEDAQARRRQVEAQLRMNAEDAFAPILVSLLFLALALFFSASSFAGGYADVEKGQVRHTLNRSADVMKRLPHRFARNTVSGTL